MSEQQLNIACLCPTYLRPDCLRNAVACFHAQDYPAENRRLFVFDDGGQFASGFDRNVHVYSQSQKITLLPVKFNALASWALNAWPELDAFAIWEDDDVAFPNFLPCHGATFQEGYDLSMPSLAYGNYQLPKGDVRLESAEGRFHGAWAFTKDAYVRSGGWPEMAGLTFDQQFGARLRQSGDRGDPSRHGLSYVYRWGNGIYHGSQFGDVDFSRKVKELDLPRDFQGKLEPEMDTETRILFHKWQNNILPQPAESVLT